MAIISLYVTFLLSDYIPDFKFIRTRHGSLLMVNGYTFSKHSRSNNYYCSKKDQGCKARLKMEGNGVIVKQDVHHLHPPPSYVRTTSGVYVKVSS